jgi:hypothetical protein
MNFLRRHPEAQFHAVLNEATMVGDERNYLLRSREYTRRTLEYLLGHRVFDMGVDPSMTLDHYIQNDALLKKKIDTMSTLGDIGAAEILALRGNIQLRGAEDKEL